MSSMALRVSAVLLWLGYFFGPIDLLLISTNLSDKLHLWRNQNSLLFQPQYGTSQSNRWPLVFNYPCKVSSTKTAIQRSWHASSPKSHIHNTVVFSSLHHSTFPRGNGFTFTGSVLSYSDNPSILLCGLINLFIVEGRVTRSVDMQRFRFFHCFFPSSLWYSYWNPSFRSNHPITM